MKVDSMKKILISDKYAPVVVQPSNFNNRKIELHYVGNPYEGLAVDVKQLVQALRELYGESIFK
jgi:hypothetical protein